MMMVKKKKRKNVEVLSLICRNVQMYWHSDESALRTQIRNTHTDTHSQRVKHRAQHMHTHTVHMSCVQFRFYIRSVRCFIFQLLVRFTSFLVFCVYSDYTTLIRLVCVATVSQLELHSHHNIVCTSIARCNYKQNTYNRTYVARECNHSIVKCCIAYITQHIYYNWGELA